jgi:glycosyltransferase involved in cell wall biosynthesis
MESDLVSIIIPVYNCENYIEGCLDSVSHQSYHNLEIIVVNDGSTDNSGKIVKRLASSDSRIKYFEQANKGVSSARNFGLKQAMGKYCCFVDSDDKIGRDYVSTMIEFISDSDLVAFYQNSEYKKLSYEVLEKEQTINLVLDNQQVSGVPWNKIYKMSIIRNNRLEFDTDISMCEDLLFNIKYISFIRTSKVITSSPKRLYFYNERTGSALRKKDERIISGALKAYDEILNDYAKIISAETIRKLQSAYVDVAIRCVLFNSYRTTKFDRDYINKQLNFVKKFPMNHKQHVVYLLLMTIPKMFLSLYLMKYNKSFIN